jgi:hypothetical protein
MPTMRKIKLNKENLQTYVSRDWIDEECANDAVSSPTICCLIFTSRCSPPCP